MNPDAGDTWYVYIIESDDDCLYTGITNNLARRWHAHLHRKDGAKYFRGRKPRKIVYVELADDRSGASRREAQIKSLRRREKLVLVAQQSHVDWLAAL